MNLEATRKTLGSSSGKALKEYLLSKLYELRNIENLNELSTATAQALETKSQKRAYLKLKEILKDLMDIEQEVKENDPRDRYDV